MEYLLNKNEDWRHELEVKMKKYLNVTCLLFIFGSLYEQAYAKQSKPLVFESSSVPSKNRGIEFKIKTRKL